ncbi:MAG: hypothetical protein KDE53_33520 [Caldilineaceae bacterium]|nr:hypothetical protein [Caldilineaceae bacterium]
MSIVTLELAQSMGLSESELMDRALAAFLQEQRRTVLQARLELLARYEVKTVEELSTKIEEALVPEHPAWEELIVAENLDARLEELDAYLHNGSEEKVTESYISDQPPTTLREFCHFVWQILRTEAQERK